MNVIIYDRDYALINGNTVLEFKINKHLCQ